MTSVKRVKDLVEEPLNMSGHVFLLGAGASLASFPNGDRRGNILPLMENFIQILGLNDLLEKNGIEPNGNFEDIYSSISDEQLKVDIEQEVHNYFSKLLLPDEATDYDRLLLSLRSKDAIFTFNWDPFLFEAYMRNRNVGVTLPEIFFLHGNVRLVACPDHYSFSYLTGVCAECGKPCERVPLLYPIEKKDYFEGNNYTKVSWEQAKTLFRDAFTISIFGYGAPSSDVEAVDLLRSAWLEDSPRQMEHIEIIDTAEHSILANRWSAFAPTHHYHIVESFRNSRLWRWPRRSCESLWYPMSKGIPCEDFPLPEIDNLVSFQDYIRELANYENSL